MRIFTSSTGLKAAALVPGEDLVLEGVEADGLDVPRGVLADDYLDPDTRRAIDDACPDVLDRWAAACGRRFTSDEVCFPWVWEFELLTDAVLPVIRRAVGLRKAVEFHRPESIAVMDADPLTRDVVTEAWNGPLTFADRTPPPAARHEHAQPPPLQRLRRAAIRAAVGAGTPSMLRRDSVLVLGYWQLMPLIDSMLKEPGWRPAVSLEKPANGPWRNLRACAQGGWLGLPGPRARARAQRQARAMISTAAASPAPALVAFGLDLGAALYGRTLRLARRRLAVDLANAATVRRAFSRARIRRVVVPYDTDPGTRLVMALAHEAGVPTLLFQHGAFLLGQPDREMELSEDVAVWCDPGRWLRMPAFRRPPHVVGFPRPHDPLAEKRRDGRTPARVLVLGTGADPCTARLDERLPMRYYETAVRAITERVPGATVVLRPHPSHDISPVARIVERFRGQRLELDRRSDILDVLGAADLCVATASTATLQSALVGTPVVVLNLSGYDWAWPVGGETAVPVARSEAELSAWLDRWAAGEALPGRDDLLGALRVEGPDPTEALMRLIGTRTRDDAGVELPQELGVAHSTTVGRSQSGA